MSDHSSRLLLSESPTELQHQSSGSHEDDAVGTSPTKTLESTNAQKMKHRHPGSLDQPGTGQYDQEQGLIEGASEAPDDLSHWHSRLPSSSGYPWSSLESIIKWNRGPDVPRPHRIRSFQRLHVAPRLLDEHVSDKWPRTCVLSAFGCFWAATFLFFPFQYLLRTGLALITGCRSDWTALKR